MPDWLDRAEASVFKRVEGGYLFQLPIGWRLGRSPCYLVNDAQKTAIGTRLQKNMKAMRTFMIAYAAVILVAIVALLLADVDPFVSVMTATIGTGAAFVIASRIYAQRTIGPLLQGLPIADKRILLSERLELQSKVLPWKLQLLAGLANLFFAVLIAILDSLIAAILCPVLAGYAAYALWLAFLGWKTERSEPRRQ